MIAKLDKILAKLTNGAFYVSMAAFIFVMGLVVLDAMMRKIVLQGILGNYEIASYALICGVFAAWSYCQKQHGHIRVYLVIMKFPNIVRLLLNAATYIIGVVIIIFMIQAAIVQAEYAYEEDIQSGILGIRDYPFFIVQAITMTLFAATLALDVIKSFAALRDKELSAEIQKDWI